MNIAAYPGTQLLDRQLPAFSISFDIESAETKPVITGLCVQTEVEGPRQRRNHLRLVGRHVDEAFGQVDILWQLDRRTLERMACDASTPVVVLERLAQHPLADVRAAVADNENAPLYTIWTLSKDKDSDVRYQLAENHNLPLTMLRSLTNDENPYVASRAQQTYDRLQGRQATSKF